MRIGQLRAFNVRKIRAVEMECGHGINIVYGKNGSGKTSLLETIHILGYGRSFRTRRIREVVTDGEAGLTAFCEVIGRRGERTNIGIEKAGLTTRIRVNSEDVKATSTLARRLPAVFIGPECSRLLEESELRRRLLDWALFHVELPYLDVYQRFHRALRQKNAALRSGASAAALDAWDYQLAGPGMELHALREKHAVGITEFAGTFLREMLPMGVAIDYRPGWDTKRSLGELLVDNRENDQRAGYTLRGPHRADLKFSAGKASARSVLSRGESKLFSMGLLLAQAAYFSEHSGETPILLVDDLGTELDGDSRARFMRSVESVGSQAFITTVMGQSEALPESDNTDSHPVRKFHVEQGNFRQVI